MGNGLLLFEEEGHATMNTNHIFDWRTLDSVCHVTEGCSDSITYIWQPGASRQCAYDPSLGNPGDHTMSLGTDMGPLWQGEIPPHILEIKQRLLAITEQYHIQYEQLKSEMERSLAEHLCREMARREGIEDDVQFKMMRNPQ